MRSFLLGAKTVEDAFNIPFKVEKAPSWTNPYITDGLVAMWDGEWNVAGGVHDADAATWKDLSGNGYDLDLGDMRFHFADNHIYRDYGTTNTYMSVPMSETVRAVETVYENTGTRTDLYGNSYIYALNREINSLYGIVYYHGGQRKYTPSYIHGYPIENNEVHSFSAAYPTNSYKDVSLRVDGQSVDMISSDGNSNVGTSGLFMVGGNRRGELRGNLYNIRIYSRALTAAEVAANYAVDKARFNIA